MFLESGNIPSVSAESDSTSPFSVPELIKSAQRAFQLLEPWCKAEQKSEHPAISLIIRLIRDQAVAYCTAINLSLDVSERGVFFGQDAADLQKMLERKDTLVKGDLLQYVDRMKAKAHQAHQAGETVADAFKQVRKHVNKISNNIVPTQMKGVEDELRGVRISKKRNERAVRWAVHVIELMPKDLGISMAVGLIPLLPHLPVVIIPVAIGISMLAVRSTAVWVEHECLEAAKVRETQELTLEQVIGQLNEIKVMLESLKENLGGFVAWWKNTLNNVSYVKRAISKDEDIEQIENLSVTLNKWSRIGRSYEEYTLKIRILQTWYPPACVETLVI